MGFDYFVGPRSMVGSDPLSGFDHLVDRCLGADQIAEVGKDLKALQKYQKVEEVYLRIL